MLNSLQRRRVWAGAALGAGVILASAGTWAHKARAFIGDLDPVVTTGRAAPVALPAGSVVIDATRMKTVKPFVARDDATAARGHAIALPEGAGTPAAAGRAEATFCVSTQGAFGAWVHAWWPNSCGNSVALSIDGSPPRSVGQDSVYNTWHWVKAGRFELSAGPEHRLTVIEREDGMAFDQVLLCPDLDWQPNGAFASDAGGADLRRFADDFSHSPGHGLGSWLPATGRWEVAFSLDPNRVPNQFALVGQGHGAGDEAVALVGGAPWKGCRFAFSVLTETNCAFGCAVDRRSDAAASGLTFLLRPAGTETGACLRVLGCGAPVEADAGGRVRIGQWHRFVVERWGPVARLSVDGDPLWARYDLEPGSGRIGLVVRGGPAVFDDVEAEAIPWEAEDGRSWRVPWAVDGDARWFRPRKGDAQYALVGEAGRLTARMPGLDVVEFAVGEADGPACRVSAPNLDCVAAADGVRVFGRRDGGPGTPAVSIEAPDGGARIRRVAVRYGRHADSLFRLGPYHFTRALVEDPSDYLDFTPEEYEQIRSSPDAERLRRQPKRQALIGRPDSVWTVEGGRWQLSDGVLRGIGADGSVRLWQEVCSGLTLEARVRMGSNDARAGVELYGGPDSGARVALAGESATAGEGGPAIELTVRTNAWHVLRIRAQAGSLAASVDGAAWRSAPLARGGGGAIRLLVFSGLAEFDDVEVRVPRQGRGDHFYAFDRRETDWWREGGVWKDHGGISCVLASNWISLEADEGQGILWNKREFGSDLIVALSIEENSEWFGWDRNPSHVHHPQDNIQVFLSPAVSAARGYRLELNARNRTATVLHRNGKPVAAVPQDADFPIRYIGGHGAYEPRRNRLTVVKKGGDLRVIVNGREVLRYHDENPIPVSRVGVGGERSRVNLTAVEICALTSRP